jgi:flagellar assembly protein FliH
MRRDGEAALARARADGFELGLAHAQTETAAALLTAEMALHVAIGQLETSFCATEARLAATAGKVCLAAAEVLAARAVDTYPVAAIDAALGRVLVQTGFRELLHLRVHPDIAAPLQALIARRQSAEQRPLAITVHEDPAVAVGDTHIVWDHGGLSLDAAVRHAAVRDALGLGPASV